MFQVKEQDKNPEKELNERDKQFIKCAAQNIDYKDSH